MRSVSLKSGRCLLLVLLAASLSMCCFGGVVFAKGTPVTSKSLKNDDSKWISSEAKQEQGVFDNLVDKNKRKPAATPVALADSSPYATTNPQANAASDPSASGSSEGGSGWVWAILASLFVVGGGLTCFGYYWSNMRRVASW
jgi:hypothetical protein